jgi:hypothetical protein
MHVTTRRANRRAIALTGVASLVAGLLLAASGAAIQPAGAAQAPQVTICHATGSTSNPYREQSVDESALDGSHGHGAHTGGVFDFTTPSANSAWGDIIPPFGAFTGLNWSAAGQAVYTAHCAGPVAPEPCPYDAELTADDPTCTPPVDPDPCPYNTDLTADDPTCTPPVDPDPCPYNTDLTADDPTCTPPVVGGESAGPPASGPPSAPESSGGILPVAAPSSAPSGVSAHAVARASLPRTGRAAAPLAGVGTLLILLGGGILVSQGSRHAFRRRAAHLRE